MRIHDGACLLALTIMAGSIACTKHQDPQELKENTAKATAELKDNAKAVAEGVREGWNRDKPLNLNTATREQVMSLPGMSAAEADAVIAGRPYSDPKELLTRRILDSAEYDRIADRVTAK
jgi:competence protein ComEA